MAQLNQALRALIPGLPESYAITTGRLSPWVIYNSESGQQFLADANEEQLAMIWPYINADVWHKKFSDYPADHEYAKEILQNYNAVKTRFGLS